MGRAVFFLLVDDFDLGSGIRLKRVCFQMVEPDFVVFADELCQPETLVDIGGVEQQRVDVIWNHLEILFAQKAAFKNFVRLKFHFYFRRQVLFL